MEGTFDWNLTSMKLCSPADNFIKLRNHQIGAKVLHVLWSPLGLEK